MTIETENENQGSPPELVKEYKGTTYIITAHFKESGGETMAEKIKRMLRNEIMESSFEVFSK